MTNLIRLHKNLIVELSLLIAAALAILVGGLNIYFLIFSVLIHELGHIIAALFRGAKAENFSLHGFGVEINFPGCTPTPRTMLIISAGGPVISLIIAFIALSLNLTILAITNLSIALVNLIPVNPLDGGNILSSLLSPYVSRKNIHKILKLSGRFFGFVITLCGVIVLYISSFNISLIYMGLFIFFSAERTNNPVVEITSAQNIDFEKCSLFIIDDTVPLLDAAAKLPINSVGAVKNGKGEITTFVTPRYLYNLSTENNTYNLKNIKKSRP